MGSAGVPTQNLRQGRESKASLPCRRSVWYRGEAAFHLDLVSERFPPHRTRRERDAIGSGHQALGFLPMDFVDITAVRAKKQAALSCHKSQRGGGVRGFLCHLVDVRRGGCPALWDRLSALAHQTAALVGDSAGNARHAALRLRSRHDTGHDCRCYCRAVVRVLRPPATPIC